MAKRYALTTIDNPHDPFTNFIEWFMCDEELGHHSISLLGRIAKTSDELSDEENNEEIRRAIKEIIANDYEGIYTMVTTDS